MDDLAPTLEGLPGPEARRLLERPGVELVQHRAPPSDQLPYRRLVRALQAEPIFGVNLAGPPAQLPQKIGAFFGRNRPWGELEQEAVLFVDSLVEKVGYMASLAGSSEVLVSLRNYFVPGNLLWHLDHTHADVAYRMVWSMGRPDGLCYTPRSNVEVGRLEEFYRDNKDRLQKLDVAAFERGEELESCGRECPDLLRLILGHGDCFLRAPELTFQVPADWFSVHRLESRSVPGTVHRASAANRRSPGLQVTIVSWRKGRRAAAEQ